MLRAVKIKRENKNIDTYELVSGYIFHEITLVPATFTLLIWLCEADGQTWHFAVCQQLLPKCVELALSLLFFFFFWLLVFVLKFVGGFFSMMTCLSFEGLLVLFVGSLAG